MLLYVWLQHRKFLWVLKGHSKNNSAKSCVLVSREKTRRTPPIPSSPYTHCWMQQSSANYSCYAAQCCHVDMCVCTCGCGWAIDLARLAWNLGHRWWSSPPSPSWKRQNDTWEKPIEIVSSLLHICHGHGNGLCGLWTQCVPSECGQFQVGLLQTSLGNYWSCACVCMSEGPHLRNECIWPLWEFKTEFWPICEISLCPRRAQRFGQLD